MSQREDVLDRLLLEVHQNVRVGIVGARAEGPRLLARVGIAITPPAAESPLQPGAILAAQRLERRHDHIDSLVPGVTPLELGHQRHVAVVVMDRIETENPPPDIVVAVHRGQM